MATFTTKAMVDRLIAGNGWETPEHHDAPDNPSAIRVVEYDTPEGETTWGVVFAGEPDEFRYERPTEYVRNPRVLWVKRTTEAVAPAVELFPWDEPVLRSPRVRLTYAIEPATVIELSEFANDNGSRTAVQIQFGEYGQHVVLDIGVGYPTEEEVLEVVGRLINVLDQARENARDRIASRSEAVAS